MKIWETIKKHKIILTLGIVVFLIFLLTWHGFFTGYEKETWESAENWVNGHYTVRRGGPISIALYLPFVLLARLIPVLHTERFFTLVPVVYSAGQAMVFYLIAKKFGATEKIAVVWAGLTALVSGVWVYANAGMEYQGGLCISLLLLALLQWQEKRGTAWWPSIAMAALLGTKAYMAVLGLPYLLFLAITLYKSNESKKFWSFKFLLSAGLIPGLFLGFNLLLNWYLYGQLSGSYRASGEFQIWEWWEGFYAVIFSSGKNMWLYAPLLIPTLWLWPRFYKLYSAVTIFVVLSLGMLAVVNLPFSYFTDETWGVRKFIPILPLLHLPLLILFQEWRIKHKILKIIFIIITIGALYINFLGATYTYSRQLYLIREAKIDSLTTMRYLPQWSHPVLYHQLFVAYLSNGGGKVYHEASWLRWLEPQNHDILLRNVWLNLGVYSTPSILWLQPRPELQRTGLLIAGLSGASLFLLYIFIKKQYEKNS